MAVPHLLAGLEVVGREAAAGGELVAAEAGDHQVLGDQGRTGDGLALLRLGVLDDPDLFAGRAHRARSRSRRACE